MLWDLFLLFLTGLAAFAQWLDGSPPWVMLFLFCFFAAMLYLRERQNQLREDFLNQLKVSRKELRAGGTVLIDGVCIRYRTELITYHATVGVLLSVVAIPSRFHLPEEGRSGGAVALSLLSLLSGWWAPTGPLHTIVALQQNLSGGERRRVCDLIDHVYLRRKEEEKNPQFFHKNDGSLRL